MDKLRHEAYLQGAKGGRWSEAEGMFKVACKEPETLFAVTEGDPIHGHFVAELAFRADRHVGLALIREIDGQPDVSNFTAVCIGEDEPGGNIVVRVEDCQHGVRNVRDATGTLSEEEKRRRYATVLNGSYSVPFKETANRLRIFRDDAAGMFHFYYAVRLEINGVWHDDWMELCPSKDWLPPGTAFFAAAIAAGCENAQDEIEIVSLERRQTPSGDRDDRNTGFAVTKREYHWSGAMGQALVVTFDERCSYADRDVKFVFWDQMNHVPAWHMNNQFLYTYEFVESWAPETEKGCFEPMSDRLNAFNAVEVLEDNAVRKVIRWRYLLTNPDYKVWPDMDVGTQQPEVEERYTIYPDGTGTRHIRYAPKLDMEFRNWHELEESIVIAGTTSLPADHIHEIPLTMLNLSGAVKQYDRAWYDENVKTGGKEIFQQGGDRAEIEGWEEMIQVAHFTGGAPDAFIVFANDPKFTDACPPYRATTDISWHSYIYQMSHWPVNKEPYEEAFKSGTTWPGQVSHSSVAGVEAWNDIAWDDGYKVDANGRRYREWVALFGIETPFTHDRIAAKTRSWLYPGHVRVIGGSARLVRYDYGKLAYEIFCDSAAQQVELAWIPDAEDMEAAALVFHFVGNPGALTKVLSEGQPLEEKVDYEKAAAGDGWLLRVRQPWRAASMVTCLFG
ncbi:hypothetical protein GXP70_21610 [Paenibacillus lycopersici]|uniref:Uncharacterized protein n=1 Tax=Paenibacillus lycopersici TaxID=2704462 RepID=A0A6C0G0C3_9BACL|nr:hypothetical protein [Paenibacillus lycopersici]QHT62317.1 hypothetical protein GXP70_21610 [Paenibacillus lycopersici]